MGLIYASPAQAQSTADAAVPKSTVTTADDLIVGSGNGTVVRLAVAASRIILKLAAGGLIAGTVANLATFVQGGLSGLIFGNVAALSLGGLIVVWADIAGIANQDYVTERNMRFVVAFAIGSTASSSWRIYRRVGGGDTALTAIINWTADGHTSSTIGTVITRTQQDFAAGTDTVRMSGGAGAAAGRVFAIFVPIA